MVEWLIKNNANVNCINKYGWTPLLYASTKGSIKHCKMLVAAGAKVNKYPRPGSKQEYLTPIWRALDKRHEEISTFLFENGAWLEPSMHLLTYDEWSLFLPRRFARVCSTSLKGFFSATTI